jgi:hypothetical protein
MLPIAAAIMKWCAEHPNILRYGILVLGAACIIGWAYRHGSDSATQHALNKEMSTVTTVKEQYDEISNHRPDGRGVIDLLRAGAF